MCDLWKEITGVSISIPVTAKHLNRIGYTSKKKFFYSEADKEKRAAYLEELKNIDPAMIVYSDETGIDDNEVTMRGWSPKGQRCYASKRGFKKHAIILLRPLTTITCFRHLYLKDIQMLLYMKRIYKKFLFQS